ncbi:hypothetical protein, partial [Actinoplanes utahensis]|uniref:hypothetical protein n=1 Tax=Actinoplanes utahensis TaxID=1869 RepID=UPI001951E997
ILDDRPPESMANRPRSRREVDKRQSGEAAGRRGGGAARRRGESRKKARFRWRIDHDLGGRR